MLSSGQAQSRGELDHIRSELWIQRDEAPLWGEKAFGRKGAGVWKPHLCPWTVSLFQESLHSCCFTFRLLTLELNPSLTYMSGLGFHTSCCLLVQGE